MDKADLEKAIRRCAAIEDELESLGANALITEINTLRMVIKKELVKFIEELGPDHFPTQTSHYDEVSNWEATVVQRTKDEWDLGAFADAVSVNQKKRYIHYEVNKDAVKEGIANGDLSRAKLEAMGAVSRIPYSYALYVRERKQDAPI